MAGCAKSGNDRTRYQCPGRYLTQDDPVQSDKAAELIESRLTARDPGFISIVALAETVCVLERAYRLADEDISRPSSVRSRDVLVVARKSSPP